MTENAYADHLRGKGVPEAEIAEKLLVVRAFEAGLFTLGTAIETAGKPEVDRHARRMIADGSNTLENFEILQSYALWRGLRPLYVALVEVTDCHNGMETLAEILETLYGADVRAKVFLEPLPPLGADEKERLEYTKTIMGRMNTLLKPSEIRAAWFRVQHGIKPEEWCSADAAERERYAGCATVDEFLRLKRTNRNAALTGMHDRGELWFTMEMTDEVLAFLTDEHHMRLGEHNGRKGIVVTKVPYRAAQFIRETDDTLKRYYVCHCPLVREAILRGETVSSDVCYCSLGHASHFLTGMGLETLEGEVIESAVRGDVRCRFIFYLPDEMEARNRDGNEVTASGS